MNRGALTLFGIVSVLWGIPYLLIAEALDAGLGALTVVSSRILVGGVVLMALVGASALRLLGRAPWRVAVLAVVEVVIPFTLIAVAQHSVTSGTAGVLIALEPFFVLIWAGLVVRGSRPAWTRTVPGSIVGFAGVVTLLGSPGGGAHAWLLVAAAASYGLGAVLVGHWFADEPGLSASAAMLVIASPITTLIALPIDGIPELTMPGVSAVVLLGAACTAGGFAAFFALINAAGPHGASLITYAAPVVALTAGTVLRSEPLTAGSIAGAAMILAGAWVCLRRGTKSPQASNQ